LLPAQQGWPADPQVEQTALEELHTRPVLVQT
jgi:hypothetical protein